MIPFPPGAAAPAARLAGGLAAAFDPTALDGLPDGPTRGVPGGARDARAPSPAERPRAPVRTIAVAGAKGGVGTSTVAANLAVALARAGSEVLLYDADLALGDAARLLGLSPRTGLGDVLGGRARLGELVARGPAGVSVIASSVPDPALSALSRIDHAGLVALFSDLDTAADTLVVDTPSGLSDAALCPAGAAREVLVVAGPGAAALDGAAALVHALAGRCRIERFRVLANGARSTSHGLDLFAELDARVGAGADLVLDHAGTVVHDPELAAAAARGVPVLEASPRSPSARAFARLAARAARWPRPTVPAGRIEFFVERLVRAAEPLTPRATVA